MADIPRAPLLGRTPRRPFVVQDTSSQGIIVDLIPMIRQNDWPNPRRNRATIQPMVPVNLLSNTLKPVIVVTPFKAQTLPNPVRRKPTIQPAHFVNMTPFMPPTPPPAVGTAKVFRFHRRLHGY